MPPRKAAAVEAAPQIPDDDVLLAALAEFRGATANKERAGTAYWQARSRVVELLRAAGVIGFTSL